VHVALDAAGARAVAAVLQPGRRAVAVVVVVVVRDLCSDVIFRP
jgi:hypothetical protein